MEIEISQLLRATRRYWYVPAVLGILFGLLLGGLSLQLPKSYSATTQLLVTTQISGEEIFGSDSTTETYAKLVTSGPVLDRVILELGLDWTREDLSSIIVVEVVGGGRIIEVTVETDDPQLAMDIANSVARNFVTTATEVSIGEIQRNLDEVELQSNTLRDRVTVIDTRLSELDTDANSEDTQIQAEIRGLKTERLRISQTLADLDGLFRELNTDINTMLIPVTVTDTAQYPAENRAFGPAVLGFLGLVVGAVFGALWIVVKAFTDRKFRSTDQVISLPVLAEVRNSRQVDANASVELAAARIESMLSGSSAESVVLATGTQRSLAPALQEAMNHSSNVDLILANGVLADAAAMKIAANAQQAVVLAVLGETSIEELEDLQIFFQSVNVPVLGTVVIK